MVQRAIFRCRNRECGHRWARDYPHRSPHGHYYRDPCDGETWVQTPGNDASKPCPRCASPLPRRSIVKGRYSAHRRCDARCENAVGPSCECQCGGANHGRGYLIS